MYAGSCLCGKVKYEISGELDGASHCHCTMCQKVHGAAFGSYANTARSAFRFTEGAQYVASYASSPKVQRTFCSICGSTLQWMTDNKSDVLSITLGTLDTPYRTPVRKHIYVDTKAPWNDLPSDGA